MTHWLEGALGNVAKVGYRAESALGGSADASCSYCASSPQEVEQEPARCPGLQRDGFLPRSPSLARWVLSVGRFSPPHHWPRQLQPRSAAGGQANQPLALDTWMLHWQMLAPLPIEKEKKSQCVSRDRDISTPSVCLDDTMLLCNCGRGSSLPR